MKSLLSVQKAVLLCATVLLCFTVTSWKEGATNAPKNNYDTVPAKPGKKTKDLDKALSELDGATEDMEKSIRDIDWEKMNADLKEAMKNLDADMKQMNADLKKSLKEIDVEKMRLDVESSVAKIDWDEIKKEIAKAKDIDLSEMKKEMEGVKAEMQKLKPELEKNLQEARKNLDKAKGELQAYKSFVDGLESDGLINKKQGYKIEHKDGRLFINDKQQSNEVYEKYRTFLEKNKKFTLEKNEEDLKINNE